MRIAVLICSCRAYAHKRVAQRDTWLRKLTPDMPYFFYVGRGEGAVEPDVVEIDALDGYNDLPPKTHLAIRHAVSTLEFDWMIRLDDDTFMAPERLPGLIGPATSQYIGSDRCYVPMYATGGAGVILSRALAELVAAQPTPGSCPQNPDQDDGWIGLVVRNAGHKLFWTPRLHHERAMRPGPHNDLVTGHWVLPSEMRRTYATLYGERASGSPDH